MTGSGFDRRLIEVTVDTVVGTGKETLSCVLNGIEDLLCEVESDDCIGSDKGFFVGITLVLDEFFRAKEDSFANLCCFTFEGDFVNFPRSLPDDTRFLLFGEAGKPS